MKKPNIEPLINLIDKWKINKSMLAEAIGMSQVTFAKKISPNMTSYKFSEDEIILIAKVLNSFSNSVRATIGGRSKQGNFYLSPKKFQNNSEKTKGVVSGKKKEFAGGTLTAHGKNNPDAFRPFNTKFVIHDEDPNTCDFCGQTFDYKLTPVEHLGSVSLHCGKCTIE